MSHEPITFVTEKTNLLLLQAFDPSKRLPTLLGDDSTYLQLPHKPITRNVEELEANNDMQVL